MGKRKRTKRRKSDSKLVKYIKNDKHRFFMSIVVIFFLGVLLIFSAYAWFSTSLNVKVKTFNMIVGQGGGILPQKVGMQGYIAEITDTAIICSNDKLKVKKEIPFTSFTSIPTFRKPSHFLPSYGRLLPFIIPIHSTSYPNTFRPRSITLTLRSCSSILHKI